MVLMLFLNNSNIYIMRKHPYNNMPKLREFPEEKKLEVLAQALAAEDIRQVLTEGLHRRHILEISNLGLSDGIITPDQFSTIIGKIERPREFPTDPEQRLEALLSVGNTEPKQVLSLLLSDAPQSVEALRNQFISLIEGVQYKGRQWMPHGITIENYLVDSLDQIGFIAFPVIGASRIGYARTQAGRDYGQPVMAFMLNMANRLGMSMYQLLGKTATPGDSRATYNRFRTLEFLLSQHKNSKETREVDIVNLLNLGNTSVKVYLNALKKIGIVEWDSIDPELKGQIFYRWKEGKNPDEVPKYSTAKTLTQEVAVYLYRNRECNNIAIVKHLRTKRHYKKWVYSILMRNVSSILSHLERHSFAESDYTGAKVQSHINLVRGKADFVEEFTSKLRNAANGGAELRAMEQLYSSYVADHDTLMRDSRVVGFYVDVSPQLNQPTSEEAQIAILDYLLRNGESRLRDIKKKFRFDIVNTRLPDMIKSGMVVLRKERNKSFYSINQAYRPN